MQKDLLAELHLPKLNLKSLENIVTKNSRRLACVIKENNEFIKKSKTIPPGVKVIVGTTVSDVDVNFPFSTSLENIKTVKRKFILKKAIHRSEIYIKNGFKKSPCPAVTSSSILVPDLAQESNTEENDKFKGIEIPSVTHSNSKISYDATIPVTERNISPRVESLRDAVASGPRDEDTEVQILLDKSSKCSDSNSVSLNSHRSLLKPDIKNRKSSTEGSVISSNTNVVENCETTSNLEKSSDPAICVISEVIGNANTAFSEADDSQETADETPESQVITPKKTNDITKIKGWRRKQFFVEKPTTVEFYSVSRGSLTLKKKIELKNGADDGQLNEEPGNKENAFVCDSLDEFLEQEADLKIGYEIPHLFAEFGIKLTSNEVLSRPNLSEKDLKEVETRYCVPISLPSDNLDEIEENIKGVKRPNADDIKPSKALKVDECKRQSVRFTQKQAEKLKPDWQVNSLESKSTSENLQKNKCQLIRTNKTLNDIKLLSKLIALVVYPGPFVPLHPIVQYHLDKLRSYRTKVDENWAKFAASAILVKDQRCKRRIVPAYCCVKMEKIPAVKNEQNAKIEQKKSNEEQVRLKECRVVIKRLEPFQMSDPWCMEHSCYNCLQCGLGRTKTRSQVLSLEEKSEKKTKKPQKEHGETVTVSPRASFNKKIARLLAKKVRLLKANGDTLTSIDCLRILKRDTIEFIKLKFVKESFLAGYINIWYLKPETAAVRSRAFLTFSQSSPVPNAINLKSSRLSLSNLPKVITEIVSAENTFDSNEYAILHCNGGLWEIHGSLNITFGNSDKDVEQIFTSLELPELNKLQEIAHEILQVKAVKWWVLDLTQKFKLIELKSGNISTVVTRKKFLEVIELNSYGFIPLRKDFENRILGAYIIQRLLPFVLIGPYYLLETRDMILKGVSSTVPFKYYGEETVTTNYPLKFFINSVIKNLEKNYKKLEGLWLYDKMCLDKTSYIEVVTTDLGNHLPNKCSIVDIEHGYSLNSLTHSSPSGATSGIVKRKDGKEELQTVTVYLYFDIFDLGFLEGELQFDNSVIINHPLDERTKMKSHKIGDWFLSIIRRRVEFIPRDLAVRWFVTKHREDLRERLPFNKFILGGAHIVTKNGVYYLLEMSETKIERLGLDKNEIVKVMSQCEVLKEVRELKNLAKLLVNDASKSLSMHDVLIMAINEIKALKEALKDSKNEKILAETQKFNLVYNFLKLVNSFRIRSHHKVRMIENIEHMFKKENGELSEDFIKKLKLTRAGWIYIKSLEKYGSSANKVQAKKFNFSYKPDTELVENSKSSEIELLISSLQKLSNCNSVLRKPPVKVITAASETVGTTNDTLPDNQLQSTKLYFNSDRFGSCKTAQPKVLKTSSAVKEWQMQNVESGKIQNSEIIVTPKSPNNFTAKSDGFLKLTAPELPSNIKLWKNWNVKKLQVA